MNPYIFLTDIKVDDEVICKPGSLADNDKNHCLKIGLKLIFVKKDSD